MILNLLSYEELEGESHYSFFTLIESVELLFHMITVAVEHLRERSAKALKYNVVVVFIVIVRASPKGKRKIRPTQVEVSPTQ